MASKKTLTFILFSAFVYASAQAETIVLNPSAPERYVVVRGDTLWDIAERFLRDPWLWPEIWQVNPDIENPHLIYPGDVIVLTYDKDGRPRLTLQRGRPTVKLAPEARSTALETAVPTIPLDAISQFLSNSRVMTGDEYERAPYIVAFQDERVIAAQTDKAYVRNLPESEQSRFTIVRKGQEFRDIEQSNKLLGYELIEIATADLLKQGDPASVFVSSARREVRRNDRLYEEKDEVSPQNFTPHVPKDPIQGTIIAVLDGVSRIGQYHVVVLNRGQEHGIEAGHILEIMQSGRVVRDGTQKIVLPDERAGVIMVFKTFSNLSYALVMKAERDMKVSDRFRSPSTL